MVTPGGDERQLVLDRFNAIWKIGSRPDRAEGGDAP